jgi:glycosyltransferase involved in cell wall biosynthesis
MRIAQIMAGAREGGAELFFERLSIGLHEAGEAVLPVIRREPARAARLMAAGLAPVQLGFGGPLDVLTGPRLRRALAAFRPDIAIAWMRRAARFAPRGPWVLAGRLGGYYDLGAYRACAHLIANTEALGQWIVAQGWPAARVHVLPNFVPDLGGAAPVPRAALGVPEGAPLLLGLGRLHRNKGFDILIRALARLPGAHAVIAGEGPERAALEQLARATGVAERVHLPGWRQDVGALLATCDVFVCSSRVEPLGNMVLEAFSAARPVVAAAAAGPAELIDPARGVLVPIDDAAALADAIAALLDAPARAGALAAAGRARFVTAFAAGPVLALWRETLSRLVPT